MKDCKRHGYIYFRNAEDTANERGHLGVIVAAYELFGNTLTVAFAFCSPKDQFVRAKGRDKARRRLEYGKRRCKATGGHIRASWELACREDSDPVVVASTVLRDAVTMKARWLPQWARGQTWAVPAGKKHNTKEEKEPAAV
jgi:hypothetical protein